MRLDAVRLATLTPRLARFTFRIALAERRRLPLAAAPGLFKRALSLFKLAGQLLDPLLKLLRTRAQLSVLALQSRDPLVPRLPAGTPRPSRVVLAGFHANTLIGKITPGTLNSYLDSCLVDKFLTSRVSIYCVFPKDQPSHHELLCSFRY